MLDGFGQKIRILREQKSITREDFCEDESELSVRQLARIESGVSAPTLTKLQYIASRLGVNIGDLTDDKKTILPIRYEELKYTILRTPVYFDKEKLKTREEQYDEIAERFYDDLPEEEQLIVDCLQSMLDTVLSNEINFGAGLLAEYFEQVKCKKRFQINDLVLIQLYLTCLDISDFSQDIYDVAFFDSILENVLKGMSVYTTDELFIVTRILIDLFSKYLSKNEDDKIESIVDELKSTITRTQDFQRMPILYLLQWKYMLKKGDKPIAERFYMQAISYSNLMEDSYLSEQLKKEWIKDCELSKI